MIDKTNPEKIIKILNIAMDRTTEQLPFLSGIWITEDELDVMEFLLKNIKKDLETGSEAEEKLTNALDEKNDRVEALVKAYEKGDITVTPKKKPKTKTVKKKTSKL